MDTLHTYQKISKDFLETSIECDNLFEKSATISTEARKAGNQLYLQKKHDQSIHKKVMLLYSKSIAFAPNNSEELALGYGNRSALLLHLHQYQKCLIDVNRALQITQSNKLNCKLQARKQKCLNLMKNLDAGEDCDRVLKLSSIIPSSFIQSASEAVSVKYNENFGRHLVATRPIKPGEIIVAERGYVCFPIIRDRHLICSHCLSFAWNGIPCESCAFAVYCSESCREEAWQQYHDIECTLFQYISCMFYDDEDFVPDLIVAVRMLIIAIKKEGMHNVIDEAQTYKNNVEALMIDGQLRSDQFRSCINLQSYLQNNEVEADIDFNTAIAANALFECTCFLDSKNDQNSDETNRQLVNQLKSILKKLIGIVNVNSFKYQAATCDCKSFARCKNECESIRGIIVAPIGSLINHSCSSNVSRMFLPNGKMVMYTIAPVKEGEQLFESYGPSIHMEKEERQKHLQKAFNFICECQPCKENWPTNLELFCVDEELTNLLFPKIMQEFRQTFPLVTDSSIFSDDDDKWQYDEETLKHAIRLSELTYKYFHDCMLATLYNLSYRYYIDRAYYKLYGEKCTIPDKC